MQGAPTGVAADATPHADAALHVEHNHTQQGSPLFANLSGEANPDTQLHAEPPHPDAGIEDGKALADHHSSLDLTAHAADDEHNAPSSGTDAHEPTVDAHYAEKLLTVGDGTLDFLFKGSHTPESTTTEGKPSDAHDAPNTEHHGDMSLADMGAALAHGPTANTPQADPHTAPHPAETHFDTPIDHPVHSFVADDMQQATAAAARQVEQG